MPDKKQLQLGYNTLQQLKVSFDALRAKYNGKRPSNFKQLREYADELSWLVETAATKAGFVSPRVLKQIGPLPAKLETPPLDPIKKPGKAGGRKRTGKKGGATREEKVNGKRKEIGTRGEGQADSGVEGKKQGAKQLSDGSGESKAGAGDNSSGSEGQTASGSGVH